MTDSPGFLVRPITPADEPFLWEMLYQAIYVPEGCAPPPREILSTPELARYVRGWGRADDCGLLAVESNNRRPIGAAWIRLLRDESRGYGYRDDETPELSIALLSEYRSKGLGTRLMTALLEMIRGRYKAVSLSVSEENPALRLYERLGFETVSREGSSLIMRKGLRILP